MTAQDMDIVIRENVTVLWDGVALIVRLKSAPTIAMARVIVRLEKAVYVMLDLLVLIACRWSAPLDAPSTVNV